MKTMIRFALFLSLPLMWFACSDMIVDLRPVAPGLPDLTLPDGKPFVDYTVAASQFFTGPATAWQWTVTGGPGDQLFFETVGKSSFTVNGADTATMTFRPLLCGPYRVSLQITAPGGGTLSRSAVALIRTEGITVELCWDKTGTIDLDLHLHRSGTTTPWFGTGAGAATINTDDCYFRTGKAQAFITNTTPANWGYEPSLLCLCEGDPQGTDWQTYGSCHNPRLSPDNINTPALPEIIFLDNPNNGETFRVMVHYYGQSSAVVRPLVMVWCGGELVGSYGYPDFLPGFDHPGGFAAGPMWRVVDITPTVAAGQVTGCTVTPLHPAGQTTGYRVTENDTTY